MTSQIPRPAERPQRTFLKSRTFAAAEGGNDAPIGTLLRRSLATSERLDTVSVSLKTVAAMQSPIVTSMPTVLQRVVAEKIDRLNRIFDKLDENGEGIILRFLPGDLIAELNALIGEKEQQLSAVLKSRQGGASLPLCDAFLRGTCTNGVTCSYSHEHVRLLQYMRKWLTLALCLPIDEEGNPLPFGGARGLLDEYGSVMDSTTNSEPSTARNGLGATQPQIPASALNLGGMMGPGSANFLRSGATPLSGNIGGAFGMASPFNSGYTNANLPPRRVTQTVLTVNEPFGPEAWDLILRQLIDYPHVRSLVLRQVPVPTLKSLADILKRNQLERIEHVDLSRNMLGQVYPQGVLRFAKALLYNTSIASLDMAFNKLGATGVLALTQGICDGSVVEAVNFGNNGIVPSEPAYEQWCSLLAKGNLNGLRKLSLSGNRLGADGTCYLLSSLAASDYSHLTHLDLYHTGLGDRGCKSLAQFLITERTSGPGIRLLNIGWNGITSQGLQGLCVALEQHTEMQVLRVHGNPLVGRKGAIAVSQLLKTGVDLPLHTIDLRWTTPTDDGVASIAEAIGSAKYLRVIHLDHNDLDSRSEALVTEKLRKRNTVLSVDDAILVTPEDEVW